MAQVSFYHIGYITSISPGITHHWVWNNVVSQRVRAFSVDAFIPLKFPPQVDSSARLEVTRVEYRQNYHGGAGPESFEREAHFWVKNVGNIEAEYAVHMTTISD